MDIKTLYSLPKDMLVKLILTIQQDISKEVTEKVTEKIWKQVCDVILNLTPWDQALIFERLHITCIKCDMCDSVQIKTQDGYIRKEKDLYRSNWFIYCEECLEISSQNYEDPEKFISEWTLT